jgi:hypothetical protein
MYDAYENDGPWKASLYVNKRREEYKRQDYAPHGSIPYGAAPHGAIVTIKATHRSWSGRSYYSEPNQCRIP